MQLFFIVLTANLFTAALVLSAFIISTLILKNRKRKAIKEFLMKGE